MKEAPFRSRFFFEDCEKSTHQSEQSGEYGFEPLRLSENFVPNVWTPCQPVGIEVAK